MFYPFLSMTTKIQRRKQAKNAKSVKFVQVLMPKMEIFVCRGYVVKEKYLFGDCLFPAEIFVWELIKLLIVCTFIFSNDLLSGLMSAWGVSEA
ncbi:hypothetical protein NPIL_214861 [Nephila pilipes]|uniref:Uncharacterized protein n=1 Tax=Nephila pilipes TaxID=299642 RepID=A0A8X6N9I2_NEPPI|nr:hypothetical protein NPIL_214861 [Nephila pilipes]